MLRELHELHPDIMIDLDTARVIRDLGNGDADIALRSTGQPQAAGVVGRRLCIDDWTLYCSRDYAARHGVPKTVEELKQHALVGGGGGNLWRAYEKWIHELGFEEQVAIHQGSSSGLLSAVAQASASRCFRASSPTAKPTLSAACPRATATAA